MKKYFALLTFSISFITQARNVEIHNKSKVNVPFELYEGKSRVLQDDIFSGINNTLSRPLSVGKKYSIKFMIPNQPHRQYQLGGTKNVYLKLTHPPFKPFSKEIIVLPQVRPNNIKKAELREINVIPSPVPTTHKKGSITRLREKSESYAEKTRRLRERMEEETKSKPWYLR